MCVFQIPIFVFAREGEMLKHSQFGYKNSPLREEITHSFPDFVLIKAVLTTQEHSVIRMFWRQQRSSCFFVFCVVISTYALMSCIQWLSFSSKFSFELIPLFIFVFLL